MPPEQPGVRGITKLMGPPCGGATGGSCFDYYSFFVLKIILVDD